MSNKDLISSERIEKAIYLIRGEKVMLDRDLAGLYQSADESAQSSRTPQSRPISR